MIHSPVPTPVHPPSWVRPAGNLEYQETRDLAEHRRITPGGLGCDFSNGREGAPVYAMDGGKVVARYIQNVGGGTALGDGSLVLRIDSPDGGTHGYAHLKDFSVALGATVAKGAVIGHVGKTGQGITGPHLHADYQKPRGTYHEILDLIEGDNVTTIVDSVLFVDAAGNPTTRSVSFAARTHTAYKLDGTKKSVVVASPSSAPANAICTIIQSPDRDPHGPNWLRITAGSFMGFYVRYKNPDGSPTGITVAPGPPPSGGFTQADLDKANVAGYNEGRGKVQGAAAAVPPK